MALAVLERFEVENAEPLPCATIAGRRVARYLLTCALLLCAASACDPEPVPPLAFVGGQCAFEPSNAPPRPLWSQQPDRVAPFQTVEHDVSSLGQVVSCDPNKLGEYPIPEGGNPHPKEAVSKPHPLPIKVCAFAVRAAASRPIERMQCEAYEVVFHSDSHDELKQIPQGFPVVSKEAPQCVVVGMVIAGQPNERHALEARLFKPSRRAHARHPPIQPNLEEHIGCKMRPTHFALRLA